MILKKKVKVSPPEPKGPPVWFDWWVKNEFRPTIESLRQEFKREINEVDSRLDEVNNRLDNIVKKNNLKE